MRKKKILFVSEASWLSTGYSVYTKEVLSRLSQIEEFEVAELACYVDPNDPNVEKTPWKVYANKPRTDNPSYPIYKNNPVAQFGDLSFNHVLLDFKPDIVMDIRDWWMMEFEQRSPFRDFFHWAIMPTVDASPQNHQWINTYNSADSVFSYSEFGRDTILEQCNTINFVDVAPPAASSSFFPVKDKKAHRESLGVSPDSVIIGTVMRNQRRKLYPDLFESFKKILEKSKNENLFLYIHTYYPDIGWDIPQLIHQNGLSNKVLITYRCKKCDNLSIDFFKNSVQVCEKCKNFSNQLVGIHNPIDEKRLSSIYNIFDIYIQYANSEGFGMPQLEAAHCGLPVVSTYYSAMQSVIDNIGGYGIHPLSFYNECETGCNRAVPDNEGFVSLILGMLKTHQENPSFFAEQGEKIRQNTINHYTWDKTADIWAKRFLEVELKDHSETWNSPSRIRQPKQELPNNLDFFQLTNYLFEHVLCRPEWIGNHIWKRMLKDLTFGYKCENTDKDFYFNESHLKSQHSNFPFSPDDALKEMLNFRTQINEWEQARLNTMNQGIK